MFAKRLLQAAGLEAAEALSGTVPTRRAFLKGAAGAGGALVVGAALPLPAVANTAAAPQIVGPKEPRPLAFIRIAPDNTVTVLAKHLDKGQGIVTGLATIAAEELDADWSQMRGEHAPANVKLYANHFFGVQGTGGSTAVANSWDELRMAGAAARAMLVQAAAARWGVPAGEITVSKGVVSHAKSGKTATFGALAEAAAKLPVPETVTLKDPSKYTLIGNAKLHRLDGVAKTTGAQTFAMDVKRPGMLTAVVARPPRFGGAVKSFDATAAKAVPGVRDVVQIGTGVAVLADHTWAAIKGREALKVVWDDTAAETRSTDQMIAEYRKLAASPGLRPADKGDVDKALAGATMVLEAEYVFPYLAHAPMEPLNCVVELTKDGGCEIWAGAQFQTVEQMVAAGILGTTPDKIRINTLFAGGSFGRRATPNADYIAEGVMIAKAIGGRAPVHLVWTREDDIKGGRYRPLVVHKVTAGLDKDGRIVGWRQGIVSQSFMVGTPFEAAVMKGGIDGTAVEGSFDMPYAAKIPNLRVDYHQAKSPVTTLWWRSVGHTHTAYVKEAFIDELAAAAGNDPVAFRMGMLEGHPRLQGVLKLAADKAGWSKPLPKGPNGQARGRGVAVHESFGSYVAHVVEVTLDGKGGVKVDRIVCAIDCGTAVNPDVIKAQVEGGTGYGLGHAMRNAVTLTDGRVDQANFDTYEPMRLSDMPPVEVHIVPSKARPSGVGEPGVPTAAPAVANAVAAAGGKRLRNLPFAKDGIA